MKTIHTMTAALLLFALGTAAGGAANATVHCHDVVVYMHRPVEDHDRVAGTVIGAVAGGVIGHQFGGGNGKTLATVGGAVAGGAIGNHIQKEHQRRRYRTVQRVCTND